MSVQAIAWVLEGTPELPAHLLGVLIGLANHADRDGRGAYPSLATLSRYAHRGDRQVRYDLRELETLGFVREGDQRYTAHLRADRRPTVYDLAMPDPDGGQPVAARQLERGASSGRTGGTGAPHGGQPIAPEPYLNRPEPKPTPIPKRLDRAAIADARRRRTASEDVRGLIEGTKRRIRSG